MQPECLALVSSQSSHAEQDLATARILLPEGFELVGLWTGDPFFRPAGWVQAPAINGIPFGLLKLSLDARALDYLAALIFIQTSGRETIFAALDRLALNPRFTGPLTYDGTRGYIHDDDSVHQAAAFSDIPDCAGLSRGSEVNFTDTVDALMLSLTPANCTVSPHGMRPLVDLVMGEKNLFVPRHLGRAFTANVLRLPGGIEVDGAVRGCATRLLRNVIANAAEPVDPFGDGYADFLSYLEEPEHVWRTSRGRYWEQLWGDCHDLQVNFPLPDGRDFEAYSKWTENRHVTERFSPLVRGFGELYGERYSSPRGSLRTDGFNVVGYHSRLSSQGEVARSIADLLRSMDYGVSAIDYQRTPAPSLENHQPSDDIIQFAANIITVGGDTFSNEYFLSPNLFSSHVNIGYWFWELESVPQRILTSSELVDEVWAPSQFIYDVFKANLDCPVRYVPFPILRPSSVLENPEPIVAIDRPLVLCIFDYFSTLSRKNPSACIQAFKLAFPHETDDGPILIVKSINGSQKPFLALELEREAEGRSDIWFIDESWSRSEVLAATSKARVLVSLHRAEGLGLHIADALWLGTEVITTDYGGVREFSGSRLVHRVPYALTQVEGGEAIYDEDAHWAEPSVEHAANLLRTLCFKERTVEENQGEEFMTRMCERTMDHWRQALGTVAS